jgi:hypothetical protein
MLYSKTVVMNILKTAILAFPMSLFVLSCTDQGAQQGESTPIDSTNTQGTAPATYGGDDPADDHINRENTDDTGTKAHNVTNNGSPENTVKPQPRQ